MHAAQRTSARHSVGVLRARATAYAILGEFDHARADDEAALANAELAQDDKEVWRALTDLALLWAGRDYTRAGVYAQQALARARLIHGPSMLAASFNRVGNWHLNVDRPRVAYTLHRQALALYEHIDDARGLAETLDYLGMSAALCGDAVGSAAYYEQAIPLLEVLDDRQRLVTSLTIWTLQSGFYWASTTPSAAFATAEASARGERALELTRSMEWPAGEAFVLFELALWLGPRGHYRRALDYAMRALDIAESIDLHQWIVGAHATLGALKLDLLDTVGAQAHLERALMLAQDLGSANWVTIVTAYLASTYLAQQAFRPARSLLKTCLEETTPLDTLGRRLCWATLADLALAQGDATRALAIAEQLRVSGSEGQTELVVPRLEKLRGDALRMLGRPAEAEAALQQAVRAAREGGDRSLLWRLHVAYGRVVRALGHHVQAREEFAVAHVIIDELSGDLAEEQQRTTYRSRAMAFLPRKREPAPSKAAKDVYGGLTMREREVAKRIAEGTSNRAIAGELVLGERTFEDYVGNVLAKLGFSSRAQIAAWAVTHGLAPSNT